MTNTHLSPEALQYKNQENNNNNNNVNNNTINENSSVDHYKNDVFQLGVSIFHAVFGFLPYENPAKRENDTLYKKLYESSDDFFHNGKIHRIVKKIKSETGKEFVENLKDLLGNMLTPQ